MWWWFLGGLFAVAAVITIIGIITQNDIEDEMRNQNVDEAIIDLVDKTTNTVKFKDMRSGKKIELRGDGVDSSLYKGQVIKIRG